MDNQIEIRQELFSRIAKYEIMEVPDGQIARALGLNEKRLQQIRELPDYQAVVERLQIEALEQAQTLNQGWDAVEDEALGTVLETLRANPDPEFALRAAAMANKAVRRGNRGNAALPWWSCCCNCHQSQHRVRAALAAAEHAGQLPDGCGR
jgi:hypothetical protein